MHICFLTHEYPLPGIRHGGIGSFINTLGKKLVRYGHRVTVVGAGYFDDKYICHEGIHVFPVPHSKWPYAGFIDNSRRINAVLKSIQQRYPIDVVEAPEAGLAFIEKINLVKYVIRMHGGHHFFTIAENRPREKWKVFQEKRSFQKADGIVAVSRYVMETTQKFLHIPQPVRIIYNPVDLELFSGADANRTKTNELLFVGTICEKKGIRQLVQAMPLVKKEFPDVRLKIVGREWYFPKTGRSYTAYLRTFIDPSVKEHIQFIGPVPHHLMPALLEQAEVCVFPSHMEAMPLAWMEALAMGKPVVGSKEGPGPEAITDGKTGLLANPYSPEDIAERIRYLLYHKDEAKAMGRAARSDVLDRFDVNKCVLENCTFYKEVFSQGSKNRYAISDRHTRRS